MKKVKVTKDAVYLTHDEARQIFGAEYQRTVRQYPSVGTGGLQMWAVYNLYMPTWYGTARAIDTDYGGTTFLIEKKGEQNSQEVEEYQKNAAILQG